MTPDERRANRTARAIMVVALAWSYLMVSAVEAARYVKSKIPIKRRRKSDSTVDDNR